MLSAKVFVIGFGWSFLLSIFGNIEIKCLFHVSLSETALMAQCVLICSNVCKQFILCLNNNKPYITLQWERTSGENKKMAVYPYNHPTYHFKFNIFNYMFVNNNRYLENVFLQVSQRMFFSKYLKQCSGYGSETSHTPSP